MRFSLKEYIRSCAYHIIRSFVPDVLNALITVIQALRRR